jgi:hypothetical protein
VEEWNFRILGKRVPDAREGAKFNNRCGFQMLQMPKDSGRGLSKNGCPGICTNCPSELHLQCSPSRADERSVAGRLFQFFELDVIHPISAEHNGGRGLNRADVSQRVFGQ